MILIKFEKQIDDCRQCPFHRQVRMGNPNSMLGEWHESDCEKIGLIKKHDCENNRDDYKFEIPNECPFIK